MLGTKEYPDNWVVLRLSLPGEEDQYRVLAGWSGGYLSGDSWKMNSGIVKVEEYGDSYRFYGASGSIYECHRDAYGLRMNNAGMYNNLVERFGEENVEVLPEETNWVNYDYTNI